jgi:signal transduction histidine kinase
MKFTREGMEHTVFKHDAMTLLVSAKKGMIWGRLSFVIILFFVQFLFSLIPTTLSLVAGNQKMWRPGFQDAMQFYMTALVAITIITTAVLFSRFFANLRNFDRLEVRNQMANKVKEIMTKSIENSNLTNLTPETIQYSAAELKAFFNIDLLNLNLYNKNGELIKSYGKGIYIAAHINPFVLKQFSIDKYGAVTIDEEFGKEKYKSSYRTIANSSGEIVGYLNLLTFGEKHNMLDPRHSQFFAQFMLICLLTTLLIIFLSIFLIRRLIRPLSKVTERLLNISLWEDEPEIEWNRDDEFGKLVETYNFLIAKLRTSAELLERNSQEMAWKDMARQIAHEIKNPLTPMRLSTQQIMKQLNLENIDRERLDDYFKMILEQTDALNEIAASFSDFSRVNQGDGSPQDLFSILKNTLSSYNEKDVEISLENHTEQEVALSLVSRSQMIQVFNNLLKNAIQAKQPDRKQLISIVLQNHGDKMWRIQFSDTGTGMTAEVQEKLFQPNFTTKTSGMGLGLAVVKQIITARGGNITFESASGQGTTFWITLPKCV